MKNKIKTIGVLTSGGDAPGMNVAIRAVVRTAISRGIDVMGIRHGFKGLLNEPEPDIYKLDRMSVSGIIDRGGTILYTARCEKFKTDEGMSEAVENCKHFGIEGIVVIGGDGSFRGATDLSLRGIPCVGIPATIDNDINSSDYSIGFDTALDTIVEMVDRISDTSQSHERCTVVEVMGRGAGWLALDSGIAVGASVILVPEFDFDFRKDVVGKILEAKDKGKRDFIIIVAEGVTHNKKMCVEEIANKIQEQTEIDSRATVLGHVQRGGSPTVRDRIIASQMGYKAVELLSKGIGNKVVVMKNNKIIDYDIFEAQKMEKPLDEKLYKMANEINI